MKGRQSHEELSPDKVSIDIHIALRWWKHGCRDDPRNEIIGESERLWNSYPCYSRYADPINPTYLSSLKYEARKREHFLPP
jgi:hypothetical protein